MDKIKISAYLTSDDNSLLESLAKKLDCSKSNAVLYALRYVANLELVTPLNINSSNIELNERLKKLESGYSRIDDLEDKLKLLTDKVFNDNDSKKELITPLVNNDNMESMELKKESDEIETVTAIQTEVAATSDELETAVVPTNDESYIEETTVESEANYEGVANPHWTDDNKLIDLDKPVSDAVVSKEVGIDNSGTLKNFKTNPKYKAASVKNAKIYADYKDKFVFFEDKHYRVINRN